MPAVEACPYRPAVGTGKNVGVAGRDEGVGMELVVVAVLKLAVESRDCGRRIPVLCVRGLVLLTPSVGDTVEVDAIWRNAVGAEGLETLRRSRSLSLAGDGESSMISTHPDVSEDAFVSISSALRLWGTPRSPAPVVRKTDLLEFAEEEASVATGDMTGVFPFGRPDRLPIRNRGTRV